jgi:hypothetical protein
MCPDLDALQCFVLTLSSQRLYRDLFWHLALIGPVLLLALAVLLIVPQRRAVAGAALLVSAAGAAVFAAVFHDTYAMAIWRTHDSAVRSLTTSALWAGFAASVITFGLGYAIYEGVRRTACSERRLERDT